MGSKVALPTGRTGGRSVKRDFWFARILDGQHPSEDERIQMDRIIPEDAIASWSWAMVHAELNGYWLVIQLDDSTPEVRRRDINTVRASVWRTCQNRRGLDLHSTVVGDRMYIRSLS